MSVCRLLFFSRMCVCVYVIAAALAASYLCRMNENFCLIAQRQISFHEYSGVWPNMHWECREYNTDFRHCWMCSNLMIDLHDVKSNTFSLCHTFKTTTAIMCVIATFQIYLYICLDFIRSQRVIEHVHYCETARRKLIYVAHNLLCDTPYRVHPQHQQHLLATALKPKWHEVRSTIQEVHQHYRKIRMANIVQFVAKFQ